MRRWQLPGDGASFWGGSGRPNCSPLSGRACFHTAQLPLLRSAACGSAIHAGNTLWIFVEQMWKLWNTISVAFVSPPRRSPETVLPQTLNRSLPLRWGGMLGRGQGDGLHAGPRKASRRQRFWYPLGPGTPSPPSLATALQRGTRWSLHAGVRLLAGSEEALPSGGRESSWSGALLFWRGLFRIPRASSANIKAGGGEPIASRGKRLRGEGGEGEGRLVRRKRRPSKWLRGLAERRAGRTPTGRLGLLERVDRIHGAHTFPGSEGGGKRACGKGPRVGLGG